MTLQLLFAATLLSACERTRIEPTDTDPTTPTEVFRSPGINPADLDRRVLFTITDVEPGALDLDLCSDLTPFDGTLEWRSLIGIDVDAAGQQGTIQTCDPDEGGLDTCAAVYPGLTLDLDGSNYTGQRVSEFAIGGAPASCDTLAVQTIVDVVDQGDDVIITLAHHFSLVGTPSDCEELNQTFIDQSGNDRGVEGCVHSGTRALANFWGRCEVTGNQVDCTP